MGHGYQVSTTEDLRATAESKRSSKPAERGKPARSVRVHGVRLSRLFLLPALVPVALIRYVSVAIGAYYAFTSWDGVSVSAKYVGLANFEEIFSDDVARNALWNTLILSSCTVLIANVL